MVSTEFNSLREKFLEKLKTDKRSSLTILAYGTDLKQFEDYLVGRQISQVSSVRTEEIDGYKQILLEEKRFSAKSVSRKINSLKSFFRFLVSQKILATDPSLPVTHPKFESAPPRILSKMEYRALRDTVRDNTRLAAIIEILLQTGIRIGELARLELDDIHEKSFSIRQYEAQPEREVPLNASAKRAFERYMQVRPNSKSRIVFITKNHRPLNVRNIRSAIDRYFRLAGIKNATVNDLRHTFITHQLAAGASPVVIQQSVGHRRLSTTEKYLEFIKDRAEFTERLEEL